MRSFVRCLVVAVVLLAWRRFGPGSALVGRARCNFEFYTWLRLRLGDSVKGYRMISETGLGWGIPPTSSVAGRCKMCRSPF